MNPSKSTRTVNFGAFARLPWRSRYAYRNMNRSAVGGSWPVSESMTEVGRRARAAGASAMVRQPCSHWPERGRNRISFVPLTRPESRSGKCEWWVNILIAIVTVLRAEMSPTGPSSERPAIFAGRMVSADRPIAPIRTRNTALNRIRTARCHPVMAWPRVARPARPKSKVCRSRRGRSDPALSG